MDATVKYCYIFVIHFFLNALFYLEIWIYNYIGTFKWKYWDKILCSYKNRFPHTKLTNIINAKVGLFDTLSRLNH